MGFLFQIIFGEKMKTQKEKNERFFTIELKSKTNLKNVALSNGSNETVLIEGTIGKLEQAEFEEGVILQIIGTQGILRVDLSQNEITKTKREVT